MGHFRDPWHPDTEGSWPYGNAVRPACGDPNPDWLAVATRSWYLGRPVWWSHRECHRHAAVCAGDLAPDLCRDISPIPNRRAGYWSGRRVICRIDYLCIEILSYRETGCGTRYRRGGQCRCGCNQVCRADRYGVDRLDGRGDSVGNRPGSDSCHFLCLHQGRSGPRRTAQVGCPAAQFRLPVRAIAQRSGLAFLTLLFLCFWWVCRARLVSAALPDRRVWF